MSEPEITPELDPSNPEFMDRVENYYRIVDTWQTYLDELDDPSALSQEDRDAIVREINSQCPYLDEFACFTGWGIFPSQMDEARVDDATDEWVHREALLAMHLGVEVEAIEGDDDNDPTFRIFQKIQLNNDSLDRSRKTITRFLAYRAYVDMYASIVPANLVEDAFRQSQTQNSEVVNRLLKTTISLSYDVASMLQTPSFLQLSQQEQVKFVDDLVDEAAKISPLQGRQLAISKGTGFVPVTRGGRTIISTFEIEEGHPITGDCMGVGSIDRVKLNDQPVRRDTELIDPLHGLQLVVDADYEVKSYYGIANNDFFFMPPENATPLDL